MSTVRKRAGNGDIIVASAPSVRTTSVRERLDDIWANKELKGKLIATVVGVIIEDMLDHGSFALAEGKGDRPRRYYIDGENHEVFGFDDRSVDHRLEALIDERYGISSASHVWPHLRAKMTVRATAADRTLNVYRDYHYDRPTGQLYVANGSQNLKLDGDEIHLVANGVDAVYLIQSGRPFTYIPAARKAPTVVGDAAAPYIDEDDPPIPIDDDAVPREEAEDVTTCPTAASAKSTVLGLGTDDDAATAIVSRCHFDEGCGLCQEAVRALFAAILYAVPFVDMLGARPIIQFVGRPGCGKSFIFKMVSALLTGEVRFTALTGSDPREFLSKINEGALCLLDNVEKMSPKIMDLVAAIATGAPISVRKFFKGLETERVNPNVWIMINFCSIEGLRDDVSDRCLTLAVKAPTSPLPEAKILPALIDNRDELLSRYFRRINQMLPAIRRGVDNLPTFRMRDFSSVVLAIGNELGTASLIRQALEHSHRSAVLQAIRDDPAFTILENLASYLKHRDQRQSHRGEGPVSLPFEGTASRVYMEVCSCARDTGLPRTELSKGQFAKWLVAHLPKLQEASVPIGDLPRKGNQRWYRFGATPARASDAVAAAGDSDDDDDWEGD